MARTTPKPNGCGKSSALSASPMSSSCTPKALHSARSAAITVFRPRKPRLVFSPARRVLPPNGDAMTTRKLERVIPSIPASDGAGVKLRRSLGASQLARHDPFLMLDEFFSDDPDDYLAGFPAH